MEGEERSGGRGRGLVVQSPGFYRFSKGLWGVSGMARTWNVGGVIIFLGCFRFPSAADSRSTSCVPRGSWSANEVLAKRSNGDCRFQLRSKLTTFLRVIFKRRTIVMEDSSTSDHSISQQLLQPSRAPSKASMWRFSMNLCLRMYV